MGVIENNTTYKLLAQKLYSRCQKMQAENERCVMRTNSIKKLLRQQIRDVELLKRRLDKHNDNWRTIPMIAPHPKRKIEQKRGPKPKNKDPTQAAASLTNEPTKDKKVRKQRTKKSPPNTETTEIVIPPPIIPQIVNETQQT